MVRHHKTHLHRCTNRLDIYQEGRLQYANCHSERESPLRCEFDIPFSCFEPSAGIGPASASTAT
jgi:hypothetical protein